MEDVSAFVALLLVVAVLSVLLLLFATRNGRGRDDGRRQQLPLPPSPPGLPFLGHLPFLGSLPHRRLQALSTSYGPVMLLRLGRVPTVVASSAAAAAEVMKAHDLAFASRPRVRMAERLLYGRDVAFAPHGEFWRQARRVAVLHLLSHRRVHSAQSRHARHQEAAAMVGRVRRQIAAGAGGGAGEVNLNAILIEYTNGVISRAVFGGGDGGIGGGERLVELFADILELLGTVTVGELVPWLAWVDALTGTDAKATRVSAEMDGLLDRVVADHRRRRRRRRRERDGEGGGAAADDDDHRRDFVDVLLDVNEAEAAAGGVVRFDDIAVKSNILVMFIAATDTTYTTLVWAMAELINHPDEMHKLQHEIRTAVTVTVTGDVDVVTIITEDHLEKLQYLRPVIKETLRLHAPVPLLLPRETTEDTELLGFHVPARTRVVVNAWAIARDPDTWDRADEFLPERFAGGEDDGVKAAEYQLLGRQDDFRFVPFGAGRRGCPGAGFAAASMELALASLLYHFDWELPAGGPSKLEMEELNGLSVRLKATLRLVAKPWSRS